MRGVLFDVGHGSGSFAFDVARRALDGGFVPDTISTDLYASNVTGPVYDLVTTASKFLNLGLSLEDVIARITVSPARSLRLGDGAGTLDVGAPADIALLTVEEGEFTFTDCAKETMVGRQKLRCEATIRGGQIIYQRLEQ